MGLFSAMKVTGGAFASAQLEGGLRSVPCSSYSLPVSIFAFWSLHLHHFPRRRRARRLVSDARKRGEKGSYLFLQFKLTVASDSLNKHEKSAIVSLISPSCTHVLVVFVAFWLLRIRHVPRF